MSGLSEPKREFLFAPPRRWRFDFAWPDLLVALEIEGGAFSGHGHRSVGKFLRDMEKYREAAIRGWRVLRCTTDEVSSGIVFNLLQRAMPSPSKAGRHRD
jgi:very-short-patch-repair endonuclease